MPRARRVCSRVALEAPEIARTAVALHGRITDRFPLSGLAGVAAEVARVAEDAAERSDELSRPAWSLRIARVALIALTVALLGYTLFELEPPEGTERWHVEDFVQVLEPALGSIVFLGAFILFVWSLEQRWKRSRALRALHELRSLAHIVDMHQLTKDPERAVGIGTDTAHSPKRTLTPFELSRYFDYCSELLSLLSKVAALYAQSFEDDQALRGVDQVEALTTGLSRKIWQKMIVLERMVGRSEETGLAPTGASDDAF